MIKLLNTKKGFTLIEMVIGMAVFAVIIGVVTTVFPQMLRVNSEVTDLGQLEMIAAESMTELLDDLRAAESVSEVVDSTVSPAITTLHVVTENYTAIYYIDETNYILMRNYIDTKDPDREAVEVMAEGFYMGYQMTLDWTIVDTTATAGGELNVTLNVEFFEDGVDPTGTGIVPIHTEQYVVRPTVANTVA